MGMDRILSVFIFFCLMGKFMKRDVFYNCSPYSLELVKLIECFLESMERSTSTNISIDTIFYLVRKYIETTEDRYDSTLIDRIPFDASHIQTIIHSINVMQLSVFMGINSGYDSYNLEKLGVSALLHDIGKIFIPKEIINKPAKLTKKEFNVVKVHPKIGHDYLKLVYPNLSPDIYLGILEHHEKTDGHGYPHGKTQISDFGRLIAVADTFEAYTSNRPYHNERSIESGISYIEKTKGYDRFYTEILRQIVRRTLAKQSLLEVDNDKAY